LARVREGHREETSAAREPAAPSGRIAIWHRIERTALNPEAASTAVPPPGGIDGFFGTRASLGMDVVLVGLFAVLPLLAWSIHLVRNRRDFAGHKRLQWIIAAALLAAIVVFEIDVRLVSDWKLRAAASPWWPAGVLAALGAVFGVQCGANYDLTPEGAAIWLSTIPPAARAKVFTFTTSYTGPGWSGYCSLATALFLAFPEDGVTEHASGHIVGANDRGLVYGWCHVDGMRHPDQTLDASRNATMRQEGAR